MPSFVRRSSSVPSRYVRKAMDVDVMRWSQRKTVSLCFLSFSFPFLAQYCDGNCKPLSAVALIESCRIRDTEDSQEVIEFLAQNVVNWKRSHVSMEESMG